MLCITQQRILVKISEKGRSPVVPDIFCSFNLKKINILLMSNNLDKKNSFIQLLKCKKLLKTSITLISFPLGKHREARRWRCHEVNKVASLPLPSTPPIGPPGPSRARGARSGQCYFNQVGGEGGKATLALRASSPSPLEGPKVMINPPQTLSNLRMGFWGTGMLAEVESESCKMLKHIFLKFEAIFLNPPASKQFFQVVEGFTHE
eukprot:TRINITY_DN11309_c0_g1_i11.p2 TRINITY_DN11309_c0_g1~~TRINITY_DN11309_c0_g1_i11.p2  ORF type:complete len:206 (-),score=21.71 TRINITY_DN11309_c0_g1_i11:60-677(-)